MVQGNAIKGRKEDWKTMCFKFRMAEVPRAPLRLTGYMTWAI